MTGLSIKKQPTNFEPGIYFNLLNQCYHADGALSNSGIHDIRESPLIYWWNSPIFNPNYSEATKRKTDAMVESDLFHRLLLEPELFHREYQVQPSDERPDYTRKIIGRIQYEKILLAVRILRANNVINQLFTGGAAEISIFVRDPETGVMIRVRPDYQKITVIVDYKAHRRIDDYGVAQDIVTYGYDQQAGIYKWAVEEVKRQIRLGKAGVFTAIETGQYRSGIENPAHEKWFKAFMEAKVESFPFVFAFQSKEPPFICRPVELTDDAIELGLVKAREGIFTYKENFEKYGYSPWPDSKSSIRRVGLDDLSQRIYHT